MNREAGKGSKQRPGEGFAEGWARIWGKRALCSECFKPLSGDKCHTKGCIGPRLKP